MQPAPPFFVFDGDCGFCKRWAGWLQQRLPPEVTFIAYQDLDDLGDHGLSESDVETASYWVDEEGALHRGARSFAQALRCGTGRWSALGALLDAPPIGAVVDRVYPVIARHRHHLPAPGGDESARDDR